jgi:hypothetical protein
MTSRAATPEDRERFIAAAVEVFGWPAEYAGLVWDDMQSPPEDFVKALAEVCDSVVEKAAHKPGGDA